MGVEVAVAVTLNVILLSVIIAAIVGSVYYRREVMKCSTRESDYCYTIHCPVDDPKAGPCFGFATRKHVDTKGSTVYYCSNAPGVAVDAKGSPAK